MSGTATPEPPPTPPPAAQTECLEAFAAVQTASHHRGESRARRAITLCEDYPLAHSLLALTLRGQGRLREAENSARRALELQPEDPSLEFILGLVMWSAGDPHEAQRCFQAALKRAPERSDMLMDYTSFLIHQRRFEEALEQARRAEDLVPEHPRVPLLLLCATEGVWRPEVDTTVFRPPLPLDPEDPESYIRLGTLHMNAGYYNFALEEFSRALDYDPANSRVKSLFATAVKMRQAGFYGWSRSWRQSLGSPRVLLVTALPLILAVGTGYALYEAEQVLLAGVFGALATLYLLAALIVFLAGGRQQAPEEFDRLVKIFHLTPQGRRQLAPAQEAEEEDLLEGMAPRRPLRRSTILLEELAPTSGDPRKAEHLRRLHEQKMGLPTDVGVGLDPLAARRQMQDRSRLMAAYSGISHGLFVVSFIGLVWVVIMMNTGTQTPTEKALERIVGFLMLCSIGLAFFYRRRAREMSERQ